MSSRPRLAQIDLIKGAAILAVIALHGLTGHELHVGWSSLHVGQAVPVFLVVMGMNAATAVRGGRRPSLRSLYSRTYLAGRVERLLVPFALVWLAALGLGAVEGGLHFGPLMLTGVLPLAGPGNYFVSIAFEFALVFPLLFWAFERARFGTVAGCFALDLAFEIAAPHVHHLAGHDPYLYDAAVVRYLGQIALGLWIGSELVRPRFGSGWILYLAPASVAYLIIQHQDPSAFSWLRADFGTTTNVLSSVYAAALVLLGLRLLPMRAEHVSAKALSAVGRASWHIFLVQTLWFTLVRPRGLGILPLHVLATSALGVAFFYMMTWKPVAERLRGAIRCLARLGADPNSPRPGLNETNVEPAAAGEPGAPG